jgi:inorganic pyrophosphatase
MVRVFVEAESGSCDKGMYDESTLERQGVRTALRPFPYPYGFILGTKTDDGDGLDCYIITDKPLKEGDSVECEPVGVLEFFEEDETDHKVLAVPVSQTNEEPYELDEATGDSLQKELKEFITAIFKKYPEMTVRVGEILPRQAALDLIASGAVWA